MKHYCQKLKKKLSLENLMKECLSCEPTPKFCHVQASYNVGAIQLLQKSIKQRLKEIEESKKAKMS